MRRPLPLFLVPASLLALLVVPVAQVGCSDQATSGAELGDADAATDAPRTGRDGSTPADDAGTDADAAAPLPTATESEPNNGTTTTETNAMTIPGEMRGKLDPAQDVDIFGVALGPGDFWEWTLTPTTADLAPHLTVFDIAPGSLNPTRLVAGQAGAAAKLDHFVLRDGTFVAAVRDTRNVPSGSVGGPTFGYSLVAKKKPVNAVQVSFPTTKAATLASLSSIDLYTFTGTQGKGFDIVVKADRKAAPSTLDSRLSLFDMTTKKTLITNDNASGTTGDSQISSASPGNSTYMVVVENEGTNAADLSYEIEFTLKP